jgi:hypothetical protein
MKKIVLETKRFPMGITRHDMRDYFAAKHASCCQPLPDDVRKLAPKRMPQTQCLKQENNNESHNTGL